VPYPSPSTSTHVNVLFPRPTTPIVEPPPIGEGGGVEVTETVAVLIAVPLEPFAVAVYVVVVPGVTTIDPEVPLRPMPG